MPGASLAGRSSAVVSMRLDEGIDVLADLVGLVAIDVVDRVHELDECLLREVGAAVERLPSGVMNTVIGQPPRPVIAWTASM